MGDGLLIIKDYLSNQDMTFDFTPEFDGDKVKGVTVAVYKGRLTIEELDGAEIDSLISLDAEGWATLLSWVRAALEAKKIK